MIRFLKIIPAFYALHDVYGSMLIMIFPKLPSAAPNILFTRFSEWRKLSAEDYKICEFIQNKEEEL